MAKTRSYKITAGDFMQGLDVWKSTPGYFDLYSGGNRVEKILRIPEQESFIVFYLGDDLHTPHLLTAKRELVIYKYEPVDDQAESATSATNPVSNNDSESDTVTIPTERYQELLNVETDLEKWKKWAYEFGKECKKFSSALDSLRL